MMKKTLLLFLVTVSFAWGEEITIAVAANVSYAMDALKQKFAMIDPETSVRVTFGSSGKLTAQIRNGAPYGLFMAANMSYPQALYDAKIALDKPVVYAEGALAYLSQKPQDFSQGMALLLSPSIHKIAIANPKTAPYGKAAFEAMRQAGILDSVKRKFVYAESISQAVAYATRAADVGIVAKSSLYSDKMSGFKEGIHWRAVETDLYAPIKQGMVLLAYGEKNAAYRRFYDFLQSKEAQKILKAYGYIIP